MAPNEVVPGPIGSHVIENVRRLRKRAGLSLVALSARMDKVGHPILSSGLQRLENGKRRVDPDDLVGLALAFYVSPLTLLPPPIADETPVTLTPTLTATAGETWEWAKGNEPLRDRDNPEWVVEFRDRAMPKFQRKYDFLHEPGRLAYVRDYPENMVRFLPRGTSKFVIFV